ncbi:Protein of unknown function [Streptosporangium subroseum]|uniref:DUF4240 domain-containing protein n=1 Tax=Streptosporangium subroseum TaxID=106412 RepID=A0A239PBQ0_9ACTN|nr:Protein of unknown function [Streptosporangium subroseum]
MNLDEFWVWIDQTHAATGTDGKAQVELLTHRLSQTSVEQIHDFYRHWLRLMEQAYTWDLWGAAYIIKGFCSDDGFEYFRSWLILQGRTEFERAIENADSLAKLPGPPDDSSSTGEDALYIAHDACDRISGREDSFDDRIQLAAEVERSRHPHGALWPRDLARFAGRWPQLWTRFGGRYGNWTAPPQASNQGHGRLANLVVPSPNDEKQDPEHVRND